MIVDLSGYSYSGKSAYYDLLSQSPGINSFGKEVEFDLLRAQGGLLDLYQALCVSWSPIRSSEAIRRFARLICYLGGHGKFNDRLFRYGPHYDSIIKDFTFKSERFLQQLILARWHGEWPFSAFDEAHWVSILKKYLKKIGYKNTQEIYLASATKAEFKALAKQYIKDLFFSDLSGEQGAAVLLNNCFEPVDPLFSMEFFPNSRAIIVDRDPRDIYISASNNRIINGVDVGGAVVGGGVDSFIERFLVFRKNINQSSSTKILRTNFENLIINFEDEIDKLNKLLFPLKLEKEGLAVYFDRYQSAKNIRQWSLPKNYKYYSEVKQIEWRLGDYCISSLS